jgi:uncharacterized membrane protein
LDEVRFLLSPQKIMIMEEKEKELKKKTGKDNVNVQLQA